MAGSADRCYQEALDQRGIAEVYASAVVELGNKAAVDAIKITGANWNGGRVETQAGTSVRSIQVKAKRGAGGLVQGPVTLVVDLLDKLQTGNTLSELLHTGDLRKGMVGRIIGSTFHIGGDVLERFITTSQAAPSDPDGLDDGMLALLDNGTLQIDNLTDPNRVKTG